MYHEHMIGRKYSTALPALLLSLLVLAVYWQTTGFGFVNIDDGAYVFQNPLVTGGLAWGGVKVAFSHFQQQYWIPVTWLSYMADASFFGNDAGAFHRTNAILHLLNVLLVFWLFRSATGSNWKSFFAAALFGLHPLRAESVAWVTERKDVLAGFFFLLACLGHVSYAKTGKRLWLAAVAVLTLLGLMSKPVVVVLPAALLLLDFWPLGRIPKGKFRENLPVWRTLLLEKAHLFAFSAVFAVVTIKAQQIEGGELGQRTGLSGILNAAVNYLAYLYETFWPAGLYLRGEEYNVTADAVLGLICLAAIALISFPAWRFREKSPEIAFGWFWYLLVLLPGSGIVKTGVNSFADRFTYVPHVGLMAGIVWAAARLYERFAEDRRPLAIFGAVLLSLLAARSYPQVSLWKDTSTLFGRTDKITGGKSPAAKKYLGIASFYAQDYRAAYDYCGQALALDPNFPRASGYRGLAVAMLENYAEAAALLKRELSINPNDYDFNDRLAGVLLLAGDKPGAAKKALENASRWPGGQDRVVIKALGGEFKANMIAGTGLAEKKQYAEAAKYFREALRISPNDPNARASLASVIQKM
ncbi:tetratricopeptide repeat protein [bacterium]|nr:MAG: tetratricopeptide repeat protein [bacterium]